MKAKIDEDTKNVTKVKTVQTDKEVNELLSRGWELLNSGARHVDDNGYNVKIFFIMAKKD